MAGINNPSPPQYKMDMSNVSSKTVGGGGGKTSCTDNCTTAPHLPLSPQSPPTTSSPPPPSGNNNSIPPSDNNPPPSNSNPTSPKDNTNNNPQVEEETKLVVATALVVDEGKDMKPFNISANVIRDSSTKLILTLRESYKGVTDKD